MLVECLLLMTLVNPVVGIEPSVQKEYQSKQERVIPHINYTKILRAWATARRPGFAYALKVIATKQLVTPKKVSMIFQVVLDYVNGESQSFIVFIDLKTLEVYAWVETNIPEEEEPEAQDEFPAKEQA